MNPPPAPVRPFGPRLPSRFRPSAAAAGVVESLEGRLFLSATTYRPPVRHALPAAATLLATGDFNDDGVDDVVAAGTGGVSVLLSDDAGKLGEARAVGPGGGGGSAAAVVVGDFTDDGEDDVLWVAPTGAVTVLAGRGDGTFRPAVTTGRHAPVAAAASGDFDDDGYLDLAVAGGIPTAGGSGGGAAVLFGRGNGTFGPAVTLAAGGSFTAVAVGDLTGDYTDDVAAAGPGGIRVFPSHDDRTFAAALTVAGGAAAVDGSIGLVVDDFNYDGLGDLAVTNATAGTVEVLLGQDDGGGDNGGDPGVPVPVDAPGTAVGTSGGGGTSSGGPDVTALKYVPTVDDGPVPYAGTFAPPVSLAVGGTPGELALGDVNGDYDDDLVAVDPAGGRLAVFVGGVNGAGTFAEAETVAVGAAPVAALVADVTGDGLPDLVAAGGADGRGVTLVAQESADVGVTLDAPATATIGEDFTYTLTVTNHGPAAAKAVSVYQSLPAGLTFVRVTGGTFVTVDPVPDYFAAPAPADLPSGVTVGVGDLADGASATVKVTVRPRTFKTLYAYAYVRSESADAGYDDDYANAQTRVVAASGSEVELTQTTGGGFAYPGPVFADGATDGATGGADASGTVAAASGSNAAASTVGAAILPIRWWYGAYARVGQDLVYTLTLTNHGPDAAAGLTLTDTLPAGVTFVSATSSEGTVDTSNASGAGGGTVTAAVGTLAAGATATVTITVKPTAAGTIENAAAVVLADPSDDPFADDNASSLSTVVYDDKSPIPVLFPYAGGGGTLAPAAAGADGSVAVPTTAATARAAAAAASHLSVAAATVAEGAAGATAGLAFTVTRTGDLSGSATVKFDTSAGTAKAGTDFLSRRGTLTFRPGVATMQVTVPVNGDAKVEKDETLTLDLSGAVGTTVDAATATGTISNDDAKAGKSGGGGKTTATKVAIDFTTAAAGAAKGYFADAGAIFGPRQGGQSYGWDVDNAASAVEAAAGKAGPSRTYNILGGGAASAWEIALPNGKYKVRLSAGDPDHLGETYAVTAEGAAFLADTTSNKHKAVDAKGVVEVTDGRLTLAAADGTLDKLAAIKIRSA